jgi:hypothetical protein
MRSWKYPRQRSARPESLRRGWFGLPLLNTFDLWIISPAAFTLTMVGAVRVAVSRRPRQLDTANRDASHRPVILPERWDSRSLIMMAAAVAVVYSSRRPWPAATSAWMRPGALPCHLVRKEAASAGTRTYLLTTHGHGHGPHEQPLPSVEKKPQGPMGTNRNLHRI